MRRSQKRKMYKKRRSTRKYKKGGSPGLDKLGYGWKGDDVSSWPGVLGNNDSITRSNHLQPSPYGVPVGGVELPTQGDNTFLLPPKRKILGGYNYTKTPLSKRKKLSAKKQKVKRGGYNYENSTKKNSTKKQKKHMKKQSGGVVFFEDIRNFGRYLANGVQTRINGAKGVPTPVGVMPTDQPYLDKDVKVVISDPVDVETIYKTNSKSVAKI